MDSFGLLEFNPFFHIKKTIKKFFGRGFQYSWNQKPFTNKAYQLLKYQTNTGDDVTVKVVSVKLVYQAGALLRDGNFEWREVDVDNAWRLFESEDSEILYAHLLPLLPACRKSKNLYWVSTPDKDEDWFIIASNSRQARRFHEDFEGYNIGDATAKKICRVTKEYSKESAYHASDWMLTDLGFRIIEVGYVRAAIRDGKIYKEGSVATSIILEQSIGQCGLYIVHATGTSKFKIGVTIQLKERLASMQTGSSDRLELYNYYPEQNYKKLEKFIHNKYISKKIGGEWFELTFYDLEQMHSDIQNFLSKNTQGNPGKEKILEPVIYHGHK